MDSEDKCFAAAIIIAIISKKQKRKRQKRQRSVWKLWLTRHSELGVDNTLLEDFRLENDEEFKTVFKNVTLKFLGAPRPR